MKFYWLYQRMLSFWLQIFYFMSKFQLILRSTQYFDWDNCNVLFPIGYRYCSFTWCYFYFISSSMCQLCCAEVVEYRVRARLLKGIANEQKQHFLVALLLYLWLLAQPATLRWFDKKWLEITFACKWFIAFQLIWINTVQA